MEFPTLGQHCQEPTCKQSDFLPLKCECSRIFCREHFTTHCLSTGCGLPKAPTLVARDQGHVFRCSSDGCKKGSLCEMPCPKCLEHFCIEHRFHPQCPEVDEETLSQKREEFAAPRIKFEESNIPVQQQITENIRKALQVTAKAKTASKIQLMRIKQKALGPKSIPINDRAYFSIVKPKDPTPKAVNMVYATESIPGSTLHANFDLEKVSPVFVSKKMSLGRAIDIICDTCSILNENNKAGVGKVRIFRRFDGYCLGDGRMDAEIGELLAYNLLVDGDTLIVEYVGNAVKLEGTVFLKLPVESDTRIS